MLSLKLVDKEYFTGSWKLKLEINDILLDANVLFEGLNQTFTDYKEGSFIKIKGIELFVANPTTGNAVISFDSNLRNNINSFINLSIPKQMGAENLVNFLKKPIVCQFKPGEDSFSYQDVDVLFSFRRVRGELIDD